MSTKKPLMGPDRWVEQISVLGGGRISRPGGGQAGRLGRCPGPPGNRATAPPDLRDHVGNGLTHFQRLAINFLLNKPFHLPLRPPAPEANRDRPADLLHGLLGRAVPAPAGVRYADGFCCALVSGGCAGPGGRIGVELLDQLDVRMAGAAETAGARCSTPRFTQNIFHFCEQLSRGIWLREYLKSLQRRAILKPVVGKKTPEH